MKSLILYNNSVIQSGLIAEIKSIYPEKFSEGDVGKSFQIKKRIRNDHFWSNTIQTLRTQFGDK